MSGGGGGMAMASNLGQQQQLGMRPQMGQMPQGGTAMQTNSNMVSQIAPMQVGQQMSGVQSLMPSFANQQSYDDFVAQGGMQDRMAGIGALDQGFFKNLLGGQMPMNTPPPGLDRQREINPNTGYPSAVGRRY